MYTDSFSQPNGTSSSGSARDRSYSSVIRELGSSAKDLIQSEINLMTAELKHAGQDVARHSAQAAAFGALLALSIFPFLAFIVIGLGELLAGRYWLSSLIVAVVCAVIGGALAYRAYKKLKDNDLKFNHTKAGLNRGLAAVQRKSGQVKEAARGEHYEPGH